MNSLWKIKIVDKAEEEYQRLDSSFRKQILAGILKVSKAPLPSPNGYGKPLGNKGGKNLTGFFKIKYRGIGIRVVYSLVLYKKIMNIVVISKRDDDYCYKLALALYQKYGEAIFTDIFTDFLP